jgi:hypothetical protein
MPTATSKSHSDGISTVSKDGGNGGRKKGKDNEQRQRQEYPEV